MITPLPAGQTATTEYAYTDPALNNPEDLSAYQTTARTVRSVTSPTGLKALNDYDENLRLQSSTALDQVDGTRTAMTQYGYDPVGNLRSIKDPLLHETVTEWDARNRKSNSTSPQVTVLPVTPGDPPTTTQYSTEWLYDPAGNLRQVNLPDGQHLAKEYDAMNRLWHDHDQLDRVTTYTYCYCGKLESILDPKQHLTTFEYDERGLKKKMTYPGATEYQEWSYDAAGNLRTRRPVDGALQTYAYDERNRPKTMRWNDGADWADFSYDAASRLTKANNPYSFVTRTYDEGGRLTRESQDLVAPNDDPTTRPAPPGDGGEIYIPRPVNGGSKPPANSLVVHVNYEYDNDSRVNRLSISDTTYDYHFGYDPLGRFEKIYQTGVTPNPEYQYSYNLDSFVTQRQNFINSTAEHYTPDELSRIKDLMTTLPGAVTLSHETYSYDPMSRLRWVERAEDDKRDTFDYNERGELSVAKYGLSFNGTIFANPLRTVTYGLDEVGNRTSVDQNGTALPYTPNSLNQYTMAEGNPVGNGPNHELSDYAGKSYTYIHDEHLQSVTSAEGYYMLGYDALGRCVIRSLNESTVAYVYAGAQAIGEYDSTQELVASTLYGIGVDEVLAHAEGEVNYYMHQDRLGNVTAATSYLGTVKESYRYDAFGAPAIKDEYGAPVFESGINNRFMFTGREYNKFGFYEYRARAYDPKLGRFMSEDPIGFKGGDGNLFRYAGGDPVNYIDPSGLASWWSRFFTEAKEAVTDRIVVTADWIADLDFFRDAGPLDSVGGAAGEGGRGDSGGGGGGDGDEGNGGNKNDKTKDNDPCAGKHRGKSIAGTIADWAKALGSAAIMSTEYVTGTGPTARTFGSSSAESRDLASDPQLWEMAATAARTGEPELVDFGARGLLSAGIHPTRQFVGSYYVQMISGYAVVTDTKNLWSLGLHRDFAIPYERSLLGPGGTTYQQYIVDPCL